MKELLITIFTPTYNREERLKGLYESLIRQTDQRFLWMVLDDGSEDATEELVRSWQNENKIQIDYIYQENQGKHGAHNTGVERTVTPYFFTVDSDDELPPDAVETICELIEDIASRDDLAGIIAKRGYHSGEDMCTRLPGNVSEVSVRDIYKVHKVKGELALVFKTEVMREFLFPVFNNEKFVTEAVILNLISMKYKMKLLDKVIYLCDYLPDGYTNNLSKVQRNSPKGYYHYLLQEIELAKTPDELKNAYSSYIAGCWKIGYKVRLNKNIIMYLPCALVLYIKIKIKNGLTRSKTAKTVMRKVFKVKYL